MHDPLLTGLAEGRDEAFAALYDRHGRSLYRVAWALLRSRQDAEDAVQEVFLGLVRSRSNLGHVGNLRAYLFSALRHAAARLAARRKAEPACDAVPDPSDDQRDLDPEIAHWLERAL